MPSVRPFSAIHIVPALVLYGVTLLSVDLPQAMQLNGGGTFAYLFFSGMFCIGVAVYYFAWKFFHILPVEYLERYIPESVSFLRPPFRAIWPYFVFVARIWMLAGFEAGALFLMIQTLLAQTGELESFVEQMGDRLLGLVTVAAVFLFAALHLLYESRVHWRSLDETSEGTEKRT